MDLEPEWQCSCGTWNPLPPLLVLRRPETIVRCAHCLTPQPRQLLAHVFVHKREQHVRAMIRLDRAGLL